jgi:hypothetical protein
MRSKKSSPNRLEATQNVDRPLPALEPGPSPATTDDAAAALPVPKDLMLQAVSIDTLVERVNLIKDAMRRCMVEGQHFGTIPGTKKPSLWKPGAELICTLFQLGTRYPNHTNQVGREQGHFVFTLTCELFHIPSGRVIGEGVGAATTMEYRYRIQTEDRHTDHGQLIKAKYTPYDFYNTVLKIAKKRAMVDAVLTVTGASEIFTQDTEDNPDLFRGDANERPSLPRRQGAGRPLAERNAAPLPVANTETLTGVVERAWPNDYQGKRYYFARINGQQLQTTDQAQGEELVHAIGQEIRAVVEPSPKPGKFYVKSFAFVDATDSVDLLEAEVSPEAVA